RIVAAGARRDLGQPEAAAVLLQGVDLTPAQPEPWTARLRYAYAEALLDSDREDEARDWFARASEVDPEGLTGAGERLAELDGIRVEDVEEEFDGDELDGDELDDDEDDEESDEEFDDEFDDDEEDDGEDEEDLDGDGDEVVKDSDDDKPVGPDLENDEEQ